MLRQRGLLDGHGHVARQVVGGAQVPSEKTDIAVDRAFHNNLAVSRAELTEDLQLGERDSLSWGLPGAPARALAVARTIWPFGRAG